MDSDSFASTQKAVFSSLVAATRTARSLSQSDLAFNCSFDSKFKNALEKTNTRLLNLTSSIFNHAAEGRRESTPKFTDAESVETHWSIISEVIDSLLEKADSTLDEYTGAIKKGQITSDQHPVREAHPKWKRRTDFVKQDTSRIQKPQLLFSRVINPQSLEPFKPFLKAKPNAKISLEQSLRPIILNGREKYPHPYETEIKTLEYPRQLFEQSEPITAGLMDDSDPIWVEDTETLSQMLNDLKTCTEIAVDLEHHDFRSFVGIVCLMQVSSRSQDWIIDTIKLRDELHVLNAVFTDPSIIKVFHGAFMDIIWLQRDLGIYVVGLFDTFDASTVLGYTGHSLAFLLKKFENFDADKKYQLADWRQRPLPKEMLEYARSDTHFLLHIFDHMRNELLIKAGGSPEMINEVMEHSKETALKTYDIEPYDNANGTGFGGWANFLKRNVVVLTPQQLSVFKAVHEWRDKTARKEDESLHFILAKHNILNLARKMPTNVSDLLGTCHPITTILRAHATELCSLIEAAKANSEELPRAMQDIIMINQATQPGSARGSYIFHGLSDAKENVSSTQLFSASPVNVRNDNSTFWGDTFGGSRWNTTELENKTKGLSLTIPLPKVTPAIYTSTNRARMTTEKEHDKSPLDANDEVEDDIERRYGDVVILKHDVQRKRRKVENGAKSRENMPPVKSFASNTATEALDNEEVATDEISLEVENAKKLRRRLRREEKKKRKQGEQDQEAEGNESQQTFQPFDYDTAPSVLQGKPDSDGKGYHTFAKTDGPKAARGRKREKEGKSFTFRNR